MHPSKARYVTACQQLLALGAVLAVLAPATGVISLDVIAQHPRSTEPAHSVTARSPEQARSDARPAAVPSAPVDAVVEEVPLSPVPAKASTEVISAPTEIDGLGTVGVTWSAESAVADGDLSVTVRTRKDGTWSRWSDLPYDADHGPDPGSAEAAAVRPGTDALVVGDVDSVQVRAVGKGASTPADMKLAVIDPGKETTSTVEDPAIDTSTIEKPGDSGLAGGIALRAASVITAKPKIFSRAQWGADERLRDKSSLHYFEVHAGFVHHTVNANNYSRAAVPGIIRSIYAYHTQSKGWSDIGYNFLVDRFGRIWEGRYGGVSLPVVGAHTRGYNDYAFAMSAIGNYETARPSAAVLDAYARLFAWKLSLHGVDVSSTRQVVGSKAFRAINGHRDAGQTACPGKYLYAQIPHIRTLAAGYQASWTGRQRDADAVSTPYPDLFLRRTSDKAGFLLPTQGLLRFAPAVIAKAGGWNTKDTVIASSDLTGDGKGDVFARSASSGISLVYPGDGAGHFGTGIKSTSQFRSVDQITAVGDLDGDRRNDLVARNPANGRLRLYSGTGTGGFTSTRISTACRCTGSRHRGSRVAAPRQGPGSARCSGGAARHLSQFRRDHRVRRLHPRRASGPVDAQGQHREGVRLPEPWWGRPRSLAGSIDRVGRYRTDQCRQPGRRRSGRHPGPPWRQPRGDGEPGDLERQRPGVDRTQLLQGERAAECRRLGSRRRRRPHPPHGLRRP
jgi:hypothetical protein